MHSSLRLGFLAVLAGSFLFADATFDQTVKYTGGSLLQITRMMANNPMVGRKGGATALSAFQDQTFKVYIKGSKMARVGPAASTITDLDAGTITILNHERHTYSTQTFAEMQQRLDQMQQRMDRGQGGHVQFDVKIDKTGKTQEIDGQTATETMVTLTAKPGSANSQMVVKMNSWLIPLNTTAREAVDYLKRLSEKFSVGVAGPPGFGAAASGISAATNAGLQLDGYPVLSDLEISGVSAPMAGSDSSAPFLTTETRSSNFGSGPVDDSQFAIPPGYTQEESRGGPRQ